MGLCNAQWFYSILLWLYCAIKVCEFGKYLRVSVVRECKSNLAIAKIKSYFILWDRLCRQIATLPSWFGENSKLAARYQINWAQSHRNPNFWLCATRTRNRTNTWVDNRGRDYFRKLCWLRYWIWGTSCTRYVMFLVVVPCVSNPRRQYSGQRHKISFIGPQVILMQLWFCKII